MLGYDLIIIGGGASGMLAAIEGKKNGIEHILVIEKDLELGGALNLGNYNISENGNITGLQYKEKLIKEYNENDIETLFNTMVLNINKEGNVICTSPERGIEELKAKNIIIANGGKDKGRSYLNMPGDRCSGVITLGMAKKFLNIDDIVIGKDIIIFGDENLETVEKELKDKNLKIKAIVGNKEKAKNYSDNILEGYKIKDILGEGRVEKIVIENGNEEKELKCDTLILALGQLSDGIVPMRSSIQLNPETTGAKVDENFQTSRKNIFAIGNGIYIHKSIEEIEKEAKKVIENIK
ncbi:MAG: NAD(P)/FAD-dependent oxidoreductase [Clostridium sp.]|uniref:NAD(P)/FAD-dependent oxidoreductase n=1 Tax=Clostridium sp. TaxID=1506 RepID=UPI003F406236